ncbi:hypothetical protein K8T06_07955, partial [bacterium]|nr:hypothetical protein [bacterium]
LNVRLQNRKYPGKHIGNHDESFLADPESVPDNLPLHGTVDIRPFPACLSTLYLTKATGVIRFIEGKHTRTFYLEKGFVRGTQSSRKDENLQRLMLKWLVFPGDTKRHFKSLPDSTSDYESVKTARQLCGFQDETIDAIAVRYMHYVADGAIHVTKGEFDWTPDEDPGDILLVNFVGLHPIHLLLTVIRDTTPSPDYRSMISNQDYHLAPAGNQGLLRNTYRYTGLEVCVTALTATGISLRNWLKQAEIVLPYANAFIYIMLVFRIFTTVKRSELRPDEIDAVALPRPKQSDELETVIDVQDDEIVKPVAPSSETIPAKSDKYEANIGDELDGVTEIDLRPVKKRILKTSRKSENKNLLDRELEKFNQQSTSQKRLDAIKKRLSYLNNKTSPNVLEMFNIDEDQLENGHTWDSHPVLICCLIIKLQKTGILIFSDAASETRLYWQTGRLVYAKSNKPSLRIDQVLFDLGLITEEQKQTAGNLWEESGGMRSGTGLFQQNIVNVMTLTEAVKEQIRMIILDICNMPAGDYKFISGVLPQAEYIAFDISTKRILLQGIRGMEVLGNLERILPDLNTTFKQTPGASEKAQEVHLEGVDITVLNRFRKTSTAKSSFVGMDISLQIFKNITVGLYILGLLEIQVSSG